MQGREGKFPETGKAGAGLGNPWWDLGWRDGMCPRLGSGLLIPGRSNSQALTGNNKPFFIWDLGEGELKK